MRLEKKLSRLLNTKSSRKKEEAFEARKHKSILPPEINNSIETLPIWYWWEIQRTGNVKLLDTKKSKNKLYKFLFYCASSWDDMQDQHINEFGIPEDFHINTRAKSKYAEAKALHAVSQDNWDLFLMNIAKDELDALKPKGKKSNYKTKQKIEIATGCGRIDPRVTTVVEYYHLMEQAAEENSDGRRN